MSGMFRGLCVDNRDPKGLGRIRVQVPQILGVSASGWAFPAWAFSDMFIWPQDRLPSPGTGVWVMFDSTSPDKMVWVAAFGAPGLIDQPFTEKPEYESTLTMTASNTPVWNVVTVFSGALTSDHGGVPNPNPVISLTGRNAGGNWQVLDTVHPESDGTWSIDYLVQLTGSVEYRALFEGVGVYNQTTSETIAVNTPTVSYPTTLTLVAPLAPALNKKSTFAGTLVTGGSPPAGYTIPRPNAKVSLLARPGTSGAWTTVASNALVNESTGAWAVDYTIAIAGSVQYQASFPGLGVYTADLSDIVTLDTSVGTTVSTPVVPKLVHGSGFNVSGTVKVTATGASVTAGVVELWWRHTAGGDTAWKKSAVSTTITAGTYSLTHSALTILGGTEWQVRYVGTPTFDAANSIAVPATVILPAMTALTKGTYSHTTAAFSWTAVSGAASYEVIQRVVGGAWGAAVVNTDRTHSATGLAADKTYEWLVRAKAINNAGTTIFSAYSPTLSMKTGHPAVVSSGTSGWINIPCWADDSYRNDSNGWDYVTDMRQGYATTAYGGEGYTGAAIYKGATVRDAVIAAIGSGPHSHGTCAAAEIQMIRLTDVGDWGFAVTMSFYNSTTLGSSGGKPARSGAAVNRTAANVAAGATWYNIGTAHGQAMGDGVANSLVIYRNNSTDYAAFHAYDLRLKWTWNYTSVSLVAAAWL